MDLIIDGNYTKAKVAIKPKGIGVFPVCEYYKLEMFVFTDDHINQMTYHNLDKTLINSIMVKLMLSGEINKLHYTKLNKKVSIIHYTKKTVLRTTGLLEHIVSYEGTLRSLSKYAIQYIGDVMINPCICLKRDRTFILTRKLVSIDIQDPSIIDLGMVDPHLAAVHSSLYSDYEKLISNYQNTALFSECSFLIMNTNISYD